MTYEERNKSIEELLKKLHSQVDDQVMGLVNLGALMIFTDSSLDEKEKFKELEWWINEMLYFGDDTKDCFLP